MKKENREVLWNIPNQAIFLCRLLAFFMIINEIIFFWVSPRDIVRDYAVQERVYFVGTTGVAPG